MTIKIIHNCETNEIIERDMTADELAQYQKDQAEAVKLQEQVKAKLLARQAVLDKLGLTAEEMVALLS